MHRSNLFTRVLTCWNWKCAFMSAVVRSLAYSVAMIHHRRADVSAVVLVEMAYVTLTAGLWAGLQQRALSLRSRLVGNLVVVLGVPGVAQLLDWTAHHVTGTVAPARATLSVCIFACVSALFHLYVMRNGVFLSGHGRSLADDFRRIPWLVVGFVCKPFTAPAAWIARVSETLESDAVL